MHKAQIDRLQNILAVPTYFGQEHLLLSYIINYLKTTSYTYNMDIHGNIYVVKGTADTYPCVCAHTDSVVTDEFSVNLHKVGNQLRIDGRDPHTGQSRGIGADDKAGVFVCLELLEQLPILKVVLFASEEFGCVGSRSCDPNFFDDVGYAIEFDCPGSNHITHYCNGVALFDKKGEFFSQIKTPLTELMGREPRLCSHTYTDVWALKTNFDFSCINISTGYYNYHTNNEYVIVEQVFNAIKIGKTCIEQLGNKLYPFEAVTRDKQPITEEHKNQGSTFHNGYRDPDRLSMLYNPEFSAYKEIMVISLNK